MRIREKLFSTTLYLLRMQGECPVHELENGFTLKRLEEREIDAVSIAHRDRKTVEDRLAAGDVAYWVDHNGRCMNIQWYSVHDYFVWDIRSLVTFTPGSSYLYDGFTDPEYRGKGINRASLSCLIRDAGLLRNGSIFSLTQKSNPMGWGFLEKFGFQRVASITLQQIPPIRRYIAEFQHKSISRIQFMKRHNEPMRLDLDRVRFLGKGESS